MPTIAEIKIDGQSYSIGETIERRWTYRIENINPLSTDPLRDAAETAGVPTWGAQCPGIPGLFCTSITARPFDRSSRTQAFVDVVFSSLFTTVEIQTSEYCQSVNLDVDGKIMTVTYTPPAGGPGVGGGAVPGVGAIAGAAGAAAGGKKKLVDYGQAKQFRAEITLAFTRFELNKKYTKATDVAETISATPWQGKPKEKWRCISADASSADGFRRFHRRYVFRYRERGWKSDPILFVDRLTNRIPEDITYDPAKPDEGNGYKRFDLYKKVDFNKLKLPDVSYLI